MRQGISALSISLLVLIGGFSASEQQAQPSGEWTSYHGTLSGWRYSPLSEIGPANIADLDVAWTWTPDSAAPGREFKSENTPLVIAGVMYITSGSNRDVVAINPANGSTLWHWSMDEGARVRVAPRRNSGRGVSYWTDGNLRRVFVVTPGFQLVALDAATGLQVADFGDNGVVDLKLQLGVELDVVTAAIGSSSPPLVFENTVVIGPALELGTAPVSMRNVPGRVLAVDARDGKLLWRFNTIPEAGEFGVDSWEANSFEYTGNAGAWAPLSLDEKRGYLYLPIEAATGDYYGGHRLGDNLFSSSLVCLDVRTGKRIWHYQTVHHDIWDFDNTTAPVLVDINVGGRPVEAVALMTKQAFTFVLDRVTGEPVWPIEERAVPQSDVPGEKTAPTQPFPTRPPPFDRQGISVDELIDFTPELRAAALEAIKGYRVGGLFNPPSVSGGADGNRGTLSLPNSTGGANWEHGAYDPETGILYVGSTTAPTVLSVRPGGTRSDMTYVGSLGGAPTVQGLPIIKPPYGRITALDLNRGDLLWFTAAGDTPERIASNPALAGLQIPRTGSMIRPVVLATKTMLVQGEGFGGGSALHILNKESGAVIRDIPLPAPVSSSPMSYALNGKQYIAFWMGDTRARVPATLVVMTLK